MRQLLSTAIVALVVGALAGITVSAVAQQPPGEEAVVVAGLNADTVDGRHAVKATTRAKLRANRLVAADSAGFLPSNIVKPRWALIQGVPAGFTDGTDDGVTTITITRVDGGSTLIDPAGTGAVVAHCPAGEKVTGGGFVAAGDVNVYLSRAYDGDTWEVMATNPTSGTRGLQAYAMCLSTVPSAVGARVPRPGR